MAALAAEEQRAIGDVGMSLDRMDELSPLAFRGGCFDWLLRQAVAGETLKAAEAAFNEQPSSTARTSA
jgi:hypothetical protein